MVSSLVCWSFCGQFAPVVSLLVTVVTLLVCWSLCYSVLVTLWSHCSCVCHLLVCWSLCGQFVGVEVSLLVCVNLLVCWSVY